MERKHRYEIVEHIATISSTKNVTKELNRVAFENGVIKFDLRNWMHNQGATAPLRGVTLTRTEAAALRKALNAISDI